MIRATGDNKKKKQQRYLLGVFAFLGLFLLFPAYAQAQVIFDKPPAGGTLTSNFGMRVHPVHKVLKPHTGTDYGIAEGTPINLGPTVTGMECKIDSGDTTLKTGYGKYAVVDYECNVQAKYAHLSPDGCDPKNRVLKTGNTGTSTNPHLHFEILLGGARIDPEDAYGLDLCKAEVREDLIKKANVKLNNQAGKDGETAPINDGAGGTTTYVPPGGGGGTIPDGNGGTITLPPGGGYYIHQDDDGRITVTLDPNVHDNIPAITQGTAGDLTPTTDTDNEVTGCAVDTWTAMVNKSVLETRREMLANQFYVTKPDSTMAYACLTEQITPVRESAGPIFSETKDWVNKEIDIITKTVTVNKELGEYSLDGAIVNAALTPYESFIRSFFSHDYLGGFENTSQGDDQAYAHCGIMAEVWKMAKCTNADQSPMFYTFEELINTDPRKYPSRYECNFTGITQEQIDLAKNKSVKFDKLQLHYDWLGPVGEDSVCAPPVWTGVTVTLPDPKPGKPIAAEKTYEDAVCVTAGCVLKDDNCVPIGQSGS